MTSQKNKIEIVTNPSEELIAFLDKKIEEFNVERWEIKERKPLACVIKDEDGEILAGATANTFGKWLLIANIWVSEKLRGQKIGTKLLNELEENARKRGCEYSLLDTLNFQAKPFYERHGYIVEWIQQNYPKDGCKYFMTKSLKS